MGTYGVCMRYGFAIVFVTAVLNAVASTAHAQDRRGFWIGTTIGVGSVDASAAGVSDFDRSRIGAFDIETGWAVNPRLLVGVEVNAFAVTLFNATTIRDVGITDVSATVTYYPPQSSGLFVKAGAGPSFAYALDDSPAGEVSGSGLGAIVGAGYDLYLGRNFSLMTGVDFRFGNMGELAFGQQAGFRSWKHNVLDVVTVGIKFN